MLVMWVIILHLYTKQWSNCKIRARGTLSPPSPFPSTFLFPYPFLPFPLPLSFPPSFPLEVGPLKSIDVKKSFYVFYSGHVFFTFFNGFFIFPTFFFIFKNVH